MSTTDEVKDHYDKFPYPTVVNLAVPQPVDHRRRRLSYLLGRREADAIPRKARIWIAGCGTQQAAHWALSFPEGEILATDLSAEVLGRAQKLSSELGLSNVQFAQHDLMGPPPELETFDLVVSTGVIHHLPSPDEGLHHLREALRPDGAIQLMVYGTAQRAPLAAIRRATAMLAQPTMSQDERYALAVRVLKSTLESGACAPLGKAALEMLQTFVDDDPSFVADALLHPLEQTYDVDGLLSLLDQAGLTHRSWMQPALWRLESHLDDGQLVALSHGLPAAQQWRIVYELTGLAAPLLEVLAVPKEAPAPEPYSVVERKQMKLQACRSARVVAVKDGQPVGTAEVPSFKVEGEAIVGRAQAGYGSPRAWRLPGYVAPLLEACDGTAAAEELAQRFDAEFGADAIHDLFATLMPDDIGLLVPAW